MNTQDKIKKYKIDPNKLVQEELFLNAESSTLQWIKKLNDFLKRHNVLDARIQGQLDQYEGYFSGVTLVASVPKTDLELDQEIKQFEVQAEIKARNAEAAKIKKEQEIQKLIEKIVDETGVTPDLARKIVAMKTSE